jgi:DNA repair protein RadC
METIKDLPLLERPREKLLHFGPEALSNVELIAILLGSGNNKMPVMRIGEQLIGAIDNQPDRLAGITFEQLQEIKGIGEVKAILLAAAVELGKRVVCAHGRPLLLETVDQVAAFLSPYLARQESAGYYLVMCNKRKELLATQEFTIAEGVPPPVNSIMQAALSAGAADVKLCRQSFDLPQSYIDKENAFASQLDAAAGMMGMAWRGILVLDGTFQIQK